MTSSSLRFEQSGHIGNRGRCHVKQSTPRPAWAVHARFDQRGVVRGLVRVVGKAAAWSVSFRNMQYVDALDTPTSAPGG